MIKTGILCPVCKEERLHQTETVKHFEVFCPKCGFAWGDYDRPKAEQTRKRLPKLVRNSWTALRMKWLREQEWFEKLVGGVGGEGGAR